MSSAVRSPAWQLPEASSVETVLRIERVVAIARVLFTVVTVIAVFHDAAVIPAERVVLYSLVTAYVTFSAVVLILGRVAPNVVLRIASVIHVVDVLFAAGVTLLTAGSGSPFFVFFVFVLFVTSVQSTTTAALLTAAAIAVLFLAGSQVVAFATLIEPAVEPTRTLVETCYVAVLTLMLAFTAMQARAVRAESDAVSRVLDGACTASSFSEALRPFLDACLDRLGSLRAVVAAENLDARRLYLWTARRPTRDSRTALTVEDLAPDDRSIYFAPTPRPALVWYARRTKDGRLFSQGVAGEKLEAVIPMNGRFMSGVLDRHAASSALTAEVNPGPEWRVRLVLFDPDAPAIEDFYFLRHLVRRGAPALHNAYSIRNVRSRVAATERARLARELHDGLLQSLIALEMEIEVLRRTAGHGLVWETRLGDLRDQLRRDISEVRDLMARLRSVEMTGDDVLRLIAELAGRLRRETDIDVRIASNGSLLDCTPRNCAHLARIVQEALTNIRKHSGARSVTITVLDTPGGGRFSIADDGRGFGFKGRMTLDQLEASDLGPALIKERVRAMGGRLAIESQPGEGARIDVEWTKVPHA